MKKLTKSLVLSAMALDVEYMTHTTGIDTQYSVFIEDGVFLSTVGISYEF